MSYYVLLLKSIIRKDVLYLRRYWLNSFFSVVIMCLFFLILAYGVKNLKTIGDFNAYSLFSGYIVWVFMTTIFSTLVTNTSNEASLGTLEQLYINSKSYYVTIMMQGISSYLIIFIQISILIILLVLISVIPINLLVRYFISVPFFLLGVPALWGIGLFLAAIVLRYKNVTSIYTSLSSLLFALISYISSSYYSWEYLFIPFSPASSYIQTIIVNGFYVDVVLICEIILNSLFFFIFGILFFKNYEEKSKLNARFAQH